MDELNVLCSIHSMPLHREKEPTVSSDDFKQNFKNFQKDLQRMKEFSSEIPNMLYKNPSCKSMAFSICVGLFESF